MARPARLQQDQWFSETIYAFQYFDHADTGNEEHEYYEANKILGIIHFLGLGTDKNAKKAKECFLRAVKCNDAEAQFWIGVVLLKDDAAPTDNSEGVEWLKKSAANNYEEANELLENVENIRYLLEKLISQKQFEIEKQQRLQEEKNHVRSVERISYFENRDTQIVRLTFLIERNDRVGGIKFGSLKEMNLCNRIHKTGL